MPRATPGRAPPAIPVRRAQAGRWVKDPASGAVTLFALNRHLEQPMPLEVALRGFGLPVLDQALQLRHASLKATNTKAAPGHRTHARGSSGCWLAA